MSTPLGSVPVHLITGFLGSGKSTLIHRLIAQKPLDERWVVLVNEFGQVGIDQAMFAERDDLVVQGLPGGCLCCQLAFVLKATLVKLLRRHRPDRLIIEPSGLGHPAGVVDILRGAGFHDVLEVRDIIAVLDPRRLDDPRVRGHETFLAQLAMADAVALTMTDLATPDQCRDAREWLEPHWPPLRWVTDASRDDLPMERLLAGAARPLNDVEASRDSPAHLELRDAHTGGVMLDDVPQALPEPGCPRRQTGASLGYATLGWCWHPKDVFDLDRVTSLLGQMPGDLRIKGVMHCQEGWKRYNRAEGTVSLGDSAWRRDSRLEIIGRDGSLPSPEVLETELQDCLCG